MAILGESGKPSGGWHAYQGSSQIGQEAEQLTMPKGGTIFSLGAWVGGWNGACDVWLTVWDAAGARPKLAQSAMVTVANEGAGGPGGSNVQLIVASLTSPLDLPTGFDFLVGFVRKQGDGHQISTGPSGSGPHFHGRSGASVQAASFAQGGDYSSEPLRIGAYVANYEPRPGAWVYRSGVWVQAEQVSVYRAGSWSEADSISVRRGAAWNEAD
jgi:hypothetical protein